MPAQSLNNPEPQSGPLLSYHRFLAEESMQPDAGQLAALEKLQALYALLKENIASRPGGLKALFRRPKPVEVPRGIYLWGAVGRGKTMLMDLFFRTAPVEKKRRIHFHEFMQEVHARIHALRQNESLLRGENPVLFLAQQIALETRLLCLDEFQVTDVADAMILSTFFTTLMDGGVTIVTTSNALPESLYQGGLQRDRYLKFAELVQTRLDIVKLESPEDYRLKALKSMRVMYHFPLGAGADGFMAEALHRLAGNAPLEPRILEVHGRLLNVQSQGGIACFTFTELCVAALGAADYLAIASQFRTVALTGIPALSPEQRNEAKRFVTLIDTLYEHKVKLLATAAAPPDALYKEGTGAFEFRRTASRLMEMQSQRYLEAQWKKTW